MMSPQTPYMTPPPAEMKPEMQPPVTQRPVSPEYNEQFIESLAQRLMPRLMPEIMYNLRLMDPARAHNRAVGLSFALAIVSIGVMIPLTAIILGVLATCGRRRNCTGFDWHRHSWPGHLVDQRHVQLLAVQ